MYANHLISVSGVPPSWFSQTPRMIDMPSTFCWESAPSKSSSLTLAKKISRSKRIGQPYGFFLGGGGGAFGGGSLGGRWWRFRRGVVGGAAALDLARQVLVRGIEAVGLAMGEPGRLDIIEKRHHGGDDHRDDGQDNQGKLPAHGRCSTIEILPCRSIIQSIGANFSSPSG